MRRVRAALWASFLILLPALGLVAVTAAQTPSPPGAFDSQRALEVSQQALGRRLGDLIFTTSTGETLSLASLGGKPLVLSLVYTSCYHVCPMTTQYLAKVVRKAREALGADSFRVATVGFDTEHDNPEAMRQFARNQGVAGSDWLLLSADKDTAAALMRDLGFTYVTSVRGFDHIIQATLIDAEGVVYRQVYGEVFETPQLVEPLKDLVLDRPRPGAPLLDGLFDRIRFFCTTYDPARDAYRFDLSIFIGGIIGVLVLGLTVWFAVRELWRGRRQHSA